MIHEYHGEIPIYHVDAYRLENSAAFLDLGIFDYFGGEGLGLIEWADRVRSAIPEDAWWIHLTFTGLTSRNALFIPPAAETGLAQKLAERLA